jgi:hypothetical protein
MRFGLLLALLLLAPVAARAGELIHYVLPDGEVGLTNDPKAVPPGATIVSRRPQGGGPLPHALPGSPAPTAPTAATAPDAGATDTSEPTLGAAQPESGAPAVPADAPQPSGGSFQVLPLPPPSKLPAPPPPADGTGPSGARAHPQGASDSATASDPAADEALFDRGITPHEKALNPPDPDDPGAEAWWQARRREAEDEVAKAAFALNRAEAIHRACQARANAAFKTDVEILSDSTCTTEALVQARKRYQDAKDYVEEGLFDDCRRAGCLPGWIRSDD